MPAVPAVQHITKLGTLRLDDPNKLHVEEVRALTLAWVDLLAASSLCAPSWPVGSG